MGINEACACVAKPGVETDRLVRMDNCAGRDTRATEDFSVLMKLPINEEQGLADHEEKTPTLRVCV